ncbi:hypothetical protein CsSME_00040306 [Camellia sinensis var. sinensis]
MHYRRHVVVSKLYLAWSINFSITYPVLEEVKLALLLNYLSCARGGPSVRWQNLEVHLIFLHEIRDIPHSMSWYLFTHPQPSLFCFYGPMPIASFRRKES